VDEVLADVLPRLHATEVALHEGDPAPRAALLTHADPVTLVGAECSASGWQELDATFR
jgi:hypothetical protein